MDMKFVLPFGRSVVFTLTHRKPHIHVTFRQKPECEQVFPLFICTSRTLQLMLSPS